MKRAIAGLLLVPVLAVAQEMPLIVGTLPNRDNSKITFTSYQGKCNKGDWLVYTQGDGGKVELTGCWRFVGDDMFVVWQDGDVYTYPFLGMTISSEMEAWLNRKK